MALVVNSFVYFSFGNIYSSKILNYADFQAQFKSGIYQYRKLSGYFLMEIYDFLSSLNIDYHIFKLKFFNPESDPRMYLTFYILNTIFLMLTAVLMVFITEKKNFVATSSEKLLITGLSILAIGLSQFVIVPYDISSYFFLALFFFFLLKYLNDQSSSILMVLGVIILFSTLNRESSALSLSLAATLLYEKFGLKKETLLPILFLGLIFIGVYLGLRFINENFSTNDGNLLLQNFTQPKNILGIIFWLVFFIFTLMLAKDKKAIRAICLFHFLSFPYIILCFYTGILYEVRLYIPLFLTSLLLSRTELSRID
ncbi:hypothetical protein EGH90_11015 [Kaistella haifensis]|nr:hypothetical protein EGH90_11015 [Kaistella haifensis]